MSRYTARATPSALASLVMASLVLAAPVLGSTAWAAEYCVSCAGPDASYSCEVPGSGSWLRCITELAREGGHESCSVDRKAVAPCPGLHKVLTAPDGTMPEADLPIQAAIPEPGRPPQGGPPGPLPAPSAEGAMAPPEGSEPAAAPKRVPQTMVELAGDTYEASKDGLKNAGEGVSNTAKKAGSAVVDAAKSAGDGINKAGTAVGNAAKKSWTCVTSLFQEC